MTDINKCADTQREKETERVAKNSWKELKENSKLKRQILAVYFR